MSTDLIQIFTMTANDNTTVTTDIRQIIAAAPDAESIIAAFGGQAKLNQTLQAIDNIDSATPDASKYIFRRQEDEHGHTAAHRLATLVRQADKGDRPSLPAIVRAWLNEFGIDKNTPEA